MASPTFGSAAVTAGAGPNPVGGNYSVTVPSGVVANEVVLAFLYSDLASNATVPLGFTLITTASCSVASKTLKVYLAYKRAGGADSGTYTWTNLTGVTWVEGLCVRISGCVTSGDPTDVSTSGALTVSGTSGPALSLTTAVTDTLLVLNTGVFDAKNQVAATGFTEAADSNDDVETCYKAQAAAGATGTCQTTWTTATAAAAILIALKSTTSTGGATSQPPVPTTIPAALLTM